MVDWKKIGNDGRRLSIDLFLILLLLLLDVIFISGMSAYWAGVTFLDRGKGVLDDLLVLGSMGIIFFILAGRVLYRLVRLDIMVFTISLFLILGTSYLVIKNERSRQPAYIPFTHGFWQKMHAQADISAIREWKEERVKKGWKDIFTCTEENSGDLPQCIRVLSPLDIMMNEELNAVRLSYGGGFGHWGLIVGPKEMELFSCDHEYVVPLEPGAYVWHEIQ